MYRVKLMSFVMVFLLLLSMTPVGQAELSARQNSSINNLIDALDIPLSAFQAKENGWSMNSLAVNPSDLAEKQNTVKERVGQGKQNVLIGFNSKPTPEDLDAVRTAGGKVRFTYDVIPAVAAELPDAAVEALKRRKNVSYIEEDALVHALSQVVPWGINHTEAPEVWKLSSGKGIKVAVLDTGIDLYHSDLLVRGGTNTIDGGDYHDRVNHGTHVAGIAAALQNDFGVVGMSPAADLYSVKVLGDNGSGTVSALIAGIDWSVKNGMKVLNMSLGTTSDSRSLKNAVDNAYTAGLLLVAAAGNSGTSDGSGDNVSYPARYDSVIAVAAIDRYNVRAPFSSTGPAIELSAPGVTIYSTLPGDNYGRGSGTSMASPHVAGAAALIWAANSNYTNIQVRQSLREGAIELGNPNHYGYGLVNMLASLKQIETLPPEEEGNDEAPLEEPKPDPEPDPEPEPEPDPDQDPEPEPAPSLELILGVKTDKPEYMKNETVLITVTGSLGENAAAGESVRVLVNRPNGRPAGRYNITLNESGLAVIDFKLKRNDQSGIYTITAVGENDTEANTEFRVR